METAFIVVGILALVVIAAVVKKNKKPAPPVFVPPPQSQDPTERGAALFGDSLTVAFGVALGSYPLPVENHAIAGTSSSDAVEKFGILHKIATTAMDTVIIRYGVVDALRSEQNRLQYNLLNMIAAAGKRRVILVGGINVPLASPKDFQANYLQVDAIMQQVAAASGKEYIDLRHVPMGMVPDLLHPDTAYSAQHAQAIADYLV